MLDRRPGGMEWEYGGIYRHLFPSFVIYIAITSNTYFSGKGLPTKDTPPREAPGSFRKGVTVSKGGQGTINGKSPNTFSYYNGGL